MKKTKFIFTALVAGMIMASCGGKKEEEKTESTEATEETTEEVKTEEAAEYTNADGRFSIRFKAEPQKQEQDVETAIGPVKMYMFMHEESATKAYMVAYCDYPADKLKGSDPKTLLTGSKEGVLSQFSATITNESMSKFQGYDACDFTASGPQYHTAYKLILADNRLYQIGILQDGGAVTEDDINSFIGSFKITGETAAAE